MVLIDLWPEGSAPASSLAGPVLQAAPNLTDASVAGQSRLRIF